MKKTLFFSLSLVLSFFAMAQTDLEKSFEQFKAESEKNFSSYEQEQQRKFDEFRRRVNQDFARMLGEKWEKEEVKEAIPIPKLPEPIKPVVKKKEEPKQEAKQIEIKEIKQVPEKHETPQPIVPIVKQENVEMEQFSFDFYGTNCKVDWQDDMKFSLSSVNEPSVAEAWKLLSTQKYDGLIADCLNIRERLELCDWAYIELLDKMAKGVLGENSQNEIVVLKMFLLTQSGYKIRIAKCNSTLTLLMPAKEEIYGYSYLEFDNQRFYVLNKKLRGSFEVFKLEFPEEKLLSMQMNQLPKISENKSEKKTFASKRYENVKVSVAPNTNLIDFYTEYPHSDWNYYSQASLSSSVKRDLYPVLKSIIEGETQIEAANILINFVQTAFEYKTDDEQFGYERTLFGDELFYYPYSDCEDRSVLFSILVRELLGLDVVLLHYPGHLATAVNFTEQAEGSFMTIDNKMYFICDPTYIGANVGEVMPQFGNVPAEIIRIAKR